MTNPSQPPSDPQIPAFLRDTPTNPVATLAYIQSQIHAIYSTASANHKDDELPKVDHDTYIKIYAAVYDYCTTTKSPKGSLSGEDLYRCLEDEGRSYCRDIRSQAFVTGSDVEADPARRLLKAYMLQYDKFTHLSNLIKNLMQFFQRHWIRREIDEKKKNRYLITDLNKKIWREEVLRVGVSSMSTNEGLGEIADAVTELRDKDGGMAEYELKLVKDVVKSLASLSLTLDS